MKTNFPHSLKTNVCAAKTRIAAKSNLTILLLLFVPLALAGCEGMESGSSGTASPWPAAATGHSSSPASQTGFASALDGRWFHDGKPTSIKVDPDGRKLTVIDENGFRTYGNMEGSREFVITSMASLDRLRGTMTPDGKRISWSNGGTWTRDPTQGGSHFGHGAGQHHGISGRWYHDGRPTSISESPGGSVTITDENGRTTSGHMMGNGEFMMSSLIRGTVSSDGKRISWSNGTEWRR
jgi:hypothetical protein